MPDFKRVWMNSAVKLDGDLRRVDVMAERTDGKHVVVHLNIHPDEWCRNVEMFIIDMCNTLDTLNVIWKDKKDLD